MVLNRNKEIKLVRLCLQEKETTAQRNQKVRCSQSHAEYLPYIERYRFPSNREQRIL